MKELIEKLEQELQLQQSRRDRLKDAQAEEMRLVYVGRCLQLEDILKLVKSMEANE